MPRQKRFLVFETLVVQDLHVLFETTIEREAHRPPPREHLRILHGRLIENVVGADGRVPLNQMQLLAVKIPGPVEPGLVVQERHVHH